MKGKAGSIAQALGDASQVEDATTFVILSVGE